MPGVLIAPDKLRISNGECRGDSRAKEDGDQGVLSWDCTEVAKRHP